MLFWVKRGGEYLNGILQKVNRVTLSAHAVKAKRGIVTSIKECGSLSQSASRSLGRTYFLHVSASVITKLWLSRQNGKNHKNRQCKKGNLSFYLNARLRFKRTPNLYH